MTMHATTESGDLTEFLDDSALTLTTPSVSEVVHRARTSEELEELDALVASAISRQSRHQMHKKMYGR